MKDPTKIVRIEAISDKKENKKASFKADDGNWYEMWKDWKGNLTDAYSQFIMGNHGEAFKKGDTARISYKVGEWNGKPQYQISSIFPAEGSEVAPQAEKPRSEAPISSQRLSEDEFSRRLGVQGHVNALLSNPEIFKIHKGSPTEATSDWIVKAAIEIENEINKHLNPF